MTSKATSGTSAPTTPGPPSRERTIPEMPNIPEGLNEPSRRLAEAISRAKGPDDLVSTDVADALSRFVQLLRQDDPRADDGPRFQRDDGVILLSATTTDGVHEFQGYVWWISEEVDPLSATIVLDARGETVTRYSIRCGLRRDAGVERIALAPGRRHLRRLFDHPGPEEVEAALLSGQLTEQLDVWYFDFRGSR